MSTCPIGTPESVSKAYTEFLREYNAFRIENGLSGKIDNIYEVLAAMTDKLGRISRYVKHTERDDPKDNWREELCTELTGLYVYGIILLNNYELDIGPGMEAELAKAAEQHGTKEQKFEGKYEACTESCKDDIGDMDIIKIISTIFKDAHTHGHGSKGNPQLVWTKDEVKLLLPERGVLMENGKRKIIMTPMPYKYWTMYFSRMMVMAKMNTHEFKKYQRGIIEVKIGGQDVKIHTQWFPNDKVDNGRMVMEFEDV